MALQKAVIDRANEETFIRRLEKKVSDHLTTPLSLGVVDTQLDQALTSSERLREIHQRITHLNPPPADIDDHVLDYEELDDRVFAVIADLRDIRRSLATPQHSVPRSHAQQHLKLPEMQLPSFDGKFEDWPSFEDLFVATIDNNPTLAAAQKLQYLKSCTKSEPHALIRSFTITDANYAEAWNLLQSKYKNTREIIHSLVKKFLYQPKCKGSGASELQTLLNTTTECIRSLSVLGCATDTWDDITTVILIDKLDPEVKSEWAKTLTGTNLPTFAELTTFLESQVRALTAKGNVSAPTRQPQQHNANFKNGNRVRVHHAAPNDRQCPHCTQPHGLVQCPKFNSASMYERSQIVSRLSACSNCLSTSHYKKDCSSKFSCKKCHQRHHTLLHRDSHQGTSNSASSELRNVQSHTPEQPPGSSTTTRSHHSAATSSAPSHVLLKTAIVLIEDGSGTQRRCRALLDDGSESSFITDSCARSLSLQREPTNVRVTGLASTDAGHSRWKVSIRLTSSVYDAYADVEALILKRVTGDLPRSTINSTWEHLKNLPLADPDFNKPGKIDLLLGADVVASIMRPGLHRGPACSPTASHTIFGWVLSGRIATNQQQIVRSFHTSIRLDEIAKQIWQESQPPRATNFTSEERDCEAHFSAHTIRLDDGRYQVRIPFHSFSEKPNIAKIGGTRKLAESRLLALERRFMKSPTHHEAYKEFMKEYQQLGHMKKVCRSSSSSSTYIPHHFVLKDDSTTTKLRVVFDASMKSTNGISLNSTMMVGATVQDDLFSLLLRFRMNPVAIKGDIAKMYRQFKVHPNDCDHQRILWRDDPSQPIEEYQLTTVTYGTASAPFLATRCLQQLATDEQHRFPEASAALRTSMYVDDLLAGTEDDKSAIFLANQLTAITATAGMSMRKFCSNSKAVMDSIPEDLREDTNTLSFDHDNYVKTLGIVWRPSSDSFTFHIMCKPSAATKRMLLSEIAKVFDPLGWLAPFTITAKILFQSSWANGQDWDDQLDTNQLHQWTEYQQQLQLLQSISIPRFCSHSKTQISLYGFSDASEKAYAACLYLHNGTTAHLLAAKTKVAPMKQVSLPRLELCSALLLCELVEAVTQALNLSYKIRCYTDSMITLKWISSTSRRWKTFVANRVAAIQEIVPSELWSHVPGIDNPADLPSRGISAEQLINSSLWWNGPPWLNGEACTYQQHPEANMDLVLEEQRPTPVVTHHSTQAQPFIENFVEKFSSLGKLITTTAILQRFIQFIKPKNKSTTSKFISPSDRQHALMVLIKRTQGATFTTDIKSLKKEGCVPAKSPLANLNPFIDSSNVLRVGGRIQKGTICEGLKHPMLLSKQSHLTELIVRDVHLRNLHSSIQLTIAAVAQQYWIVGARSYIRQLVRKCIICRKVKAETMQQQMGQLPPSRVTQNRPFFHSGVDFAGPYNIKISSRRNSAPQKFYFAVFVCMATKAVHLEVVSSLSTDAFIASFRRFTSRRGLCSHLYSDCGTNFVGAEKELATLVLVMETQLQQKLSHLGTTFHFNTPSAPNQGGLWEACVKQVKYHLRRVVGNHSLTLEQFQTLLCQIEACLNSRPLIPMSPDPNDMEPLTPGHFLIGCPLITVPDPDLLHLPSNRVDHWQVIQQMGQHFWKRWHNEYLVTLQQRAKWRKPHRNAAVGDLVIITTDNTPPATWKTGRITAIHPGADQLVRKVTIRFISNLNPLQYSEVDRPISKLAIILPEESE